MKYKKYKITDDEFIKIVSESKTMLSAAKKINMPFMTFRYRARILNIYKPNPSRIGIKRNVKEFIKNTTPLIDIINGLHPQYNTNRLKHRLIKDGYKDNKCERCDIIEWCGEPLSLQLHHKNGNSFDHNLSNLEMLCPNCHSQTITYSGKKLNGSVVKLGIHATLRT